MMRAAEHVTYATIASACGDLDAADAVALALAAARQADSAGVTGEPTALPPPERILLSSTGDVWLAADPDVAAAVVPEQVRVEQVAHLVRSLLGLTDGCGDRRRVQAPGALLLLLARAAREIDLPPLSYPAFLQALKRFEPATAHALSSIYWRCARHAGSETPPATTTAQLGALVPFPGVRPAAPPPLRERRTHGPQLSHLRRELRDADLRLFHVLEQSSRSRRRHLIGAGGAVAASLLLAALAWPTVFDLTGGADQQTGSIARQPLPDDAASPSTAPPAIGPSSPREGAGLPAPAGTIAAMPPAQVREPAATSQTAAVPYSRPARQASDVSAAPLLSAAMVGADVFSPSFAADGRALLFHAGRAPAALMYASFDERAQPAITTVLDDGATNYHATLSPDGAWLAYDSDRDGTRAVYVSRSDGIESRRVSGDGYAAVPRWSWDGRRLAFIKAEPARPRVWNVWVADLASGTLARVSRHVVGQAWGGSWFPDGQRIAYSVEDTLIIASLQDGTAKMLRSPRAGRLIRTPAVSPDGNWIVFQVYRDGVWLLDVATGAMQRLLADPAAEEFAWSPDGRRIVYHTWRSGGWSVWELQWDPGAAG